MITIPRRRSAEAADTGVSGAPAGDATDTADPQSLVLVAFVPAGVTALCCLLGALVTLLTAHSSLSGMPGLVGALWMAVHQVPFYIEGMRLGMLPLLPTALLVAGVARYTVRNARQGDGPARHAAVIASAAGGPALITLVAVGLIQEVSSTAPVSGVGLLPAVAIVAAVHAFGAVCGVGRVSLRRYGQEWRLPPTLPEVLKGAVAALATLLLLGSVLVLVGIGTGWGRISAMFAAEPSFVGKTGLFILSVLYLPNVVVGAAAVGTGTAAHVGAAHYGLFGTVAGPLPAVPLLGVLPDSPTSRWWALFLLVTVAAAVWCAMLTGAPGVRTADRLRFVVSAAAVAALGALILGYLAGGQAGVFASIGVDSPVFALAVLGLFSVAGTAVVLVRHYVGTVPLPAGGLRHGVREMALWIRRSAGSIRPRRTESTVEGLDSED